MERDNIMSHLECKKNTLCQEFKLYENKTELAKNVAKEMANLLRSAIDERGEAILVLSGGSTPQQAYIFLSMEDIYWDRVKITLADERWVPQSHPRSNHCLLNMTLLYNMVKRPHFIPLYRDLVTPEEGLRNINEDFRVLKKPFDLVLLGIGNDGHTASLFPEGDNLKEAMNLQTSHWAMSMNAPGAKEPRIKLTTKTLLQTRQIFIMFSGAEKYETFMKAQEDGPEEDMPIRSILNNSKVPISIFHDLGE